MIDKEFKGGVMDIHELKQFESVYQPSKEVAFCWLRKQYVQLSTEENHTEITDRANDSLRIWQAAKAQAVHDVVISIKDRLPKDGQTIIAFDAIVNCEFKDGEFLQTYYESDTGHEYAEPVDVTHWIAVEAQEQSK